MATTTLYARMSDGETIAEETVLCQEHLASHADSFTAPDAQRPHEVCDVPNSRLHCQVCGSTQTDSTTPKAR